MSPPASIGVDDNLTTGQTGVTLGAADHEPSRGLDLSDVVRGVSGPVKGRKEKEIMLT